MSPNICAEAAGTLNPALDHAPVPYLRLLAPPQQGCAGQRLSELMPLGFRHPHPGGMADNSPTFQRSDHDNRKPSPVGTAEESLSPAPSLPLHSSKEAWVSEIKRLIDEGKNLKLALAVTEAKADLDYGDWTAIWR